MERKKIIIQSIFIIAGLIFIVRLFFLQALDSKYKLLAENNVVEKIVDYPYRGLIYDRTGKLLVFNSPVFDIMVIAKELKIKDTLVFCNAIGITKEELKETIKKIKKEKSYSKPVALLKQLSSSDLAKIQNILTDESGLYVQARTIRSYPHQSLANLLGYIGEINKKQLEKQKDNYYVQGDYIGISGLEASYEKDLRGRRGTQYIMKDVYGARKGSYMDGFYDTTSIPGKNLYSTIDLKLQQYGESLMQNKVGSVVAIEPSTGEILAFISTPSYDPNLLTGRSFSENYRKLEQDSIRPLFNRPLMAMYPPGSIFKTAQALVAQQLKVLSPSTTYPCNQSWGPKCHAHPSPQNLKGSVQWSCNPYYFAVFKSVMNRPKHPDKFKNSELNFDEWRTHMASFGFGQRPKIDLPDAKSGFLPTNEYYDKIYGNLRWKHSTIRSLDIGQGELLVTPIQMANLAAIIANKGYYYPPHVIKGIGEGKKLLEIYKTKQMTLVDSNYFPVIIDGMEMVVQAGTAYWNKIKGITICGKTGTAQNPHGEDHAAFIAFAPKESPKIAIAVYVENSGFGGVYAAPVANLMIEKYLTDTISNKWMEQNIKEKNLIQKYKGVTQ